MVRSAIPYFAQDAGDEDADEDGTGKTWAHVVDFGIDKGEDFKEGVVNAINEGNLHGVSGNRPHRAG